MPTADALGADALGASAPTADAPTAASLVVSCEHASNHVPAAYRPLFRGSRGLLDTHRGWDPGALELARRIARRHRAPLEATTVTRLLVECNRSLTHPQLFSKFTRGLDDFERNDIINRYYLPHRARVESLVRRRTAKGARVLHVGVHSFTPVLHGITRRADVGLLYDPRRRFESVLVHAWRRAILDVDPYLRVHLNSPYRGWTDGLTTTLRTQFADRRYAGIELEVNQRIVRGTPRRWHTLQDALAESLESVLA